MLVNELAGAFEYSAYDLSVADVLLSYEFEKMLSRTSRAVTAAPTYMSAWRVRVARPGCEPNRFTELWKTFTPPMVPSIMIPTGWKENVTEGSE